MADLYTTPIERRHRERAAKFIVPDEVQQTVIDAVSSWVESGEWVSPYAALAIPLAALAQSFADFEAETLAKPVDEARAYLATQPESVRP